MAVDLHAWAARHGVSLAAVTELKAMMTTGVPSPAHLVDTGSNSEAGVQSQVRLEAAQKGCLVWRNNVGAVTDDTGRLVRFGLANESAAVNRQVKSSDLIGIKPLRIEQHHVGTIIGQFLAREVKKPGWNYTGTPREQAQMKFIELVVACGGDAAFCNSVGTI